MFYFSTSDMESVSLPVFCYFKNHQPWKNLYKRETRRTVAHFPRIFRPRIQCKKWKLCKILPVTYWKKWMKIMIKNDALKIYGAPWSFFHLQRGSAKSPLAPSNFSSLCLNLQVHGTTVIEQHTAHISYNGQGKNQHLDLSHVIYQSNETGDYGSFFVSNAWFLPLCTESLLAYPQ